MAKWKTHKLCVSWELKLLGKPHVSQLKWKEVLLMRKKLMGTGPHPIGAKQSIPRHKESQEKKLKLLQKCFSLNLIHSEVTAKWDQYDSLVQNVLFSGFISTNEEQVQGGRGNATQSSSPARSPAQAMSRHMLFCSSFCEGVCFVSSQQCTDHPLQSKQ